MTTSARAGGLVREVLRVSAAGVHGAGLVREVIRASTGQARIGGIVREVLVNDRASARVSGVRREVLIQEQRAGPILRRSRWFLRVAAPMELDDEDEQNPWYPPRYPEPAPGPKTLRPYVSINS
jgi:hypothetical protein